MGPSLLSSTDIILSHSRPSEVTSGSLMCFRDFWLFTSSGILSCLWHPLASSGQKRSNAPCKGRDVDREPKSSWVPVLSGRAMWSGGGISDVCDVERELLSLIFQCIIFGDCLKSKPCPRPGNHIMQHLGGIWMDWAIFWFKAIDSMDKVL